MTQSTAPIYFKPTLIPHPQSDTWSIEQVEALFDLPFNDLVYRATTIHRTNFDPHRIQLSTLLSIKTGGCSEDCGYCSQSVRYDTGIEQQTLLGRRGYGSLKQLIANRRPGNDADLTVCGLPGGG